MAPKWCVFQTNHVTEPVVVQNRLYFMQSIYLHWGEMWPGCVWVPSGVNSVVDEVLSADQQWLSSCMFQMSRFLLFDRTPALHGHSRFMPEKVLFRSAATKQAYSWSSTNSRPTFSVTVEERSLRDEAAHLSKCFFKLHLDFHPPVMHCSPSAPFLSAKHHTVHTTQIKYASETALYGTLTMHFWFVCEVEQALWDQDGSFSIWRVYTHSRFTVFLHRAASACFLRSKDGADASSDLYSLRYWICYSCRCT